MMTGIHAINKPARKLQSAKDLSPDVSPQVFTFRSLHKEADRAAWTLQDASSDAAVYITNNNNNN